MALSREALVGWYEANKRFADLEALRLFDRPLAVICSCGGCWDCKGHVAGCTCDVDWDALAERNK